MHIWLYYILFKILLNLPTGLKITQTVCLPLQHCGCHTIIIGLSLNLTHYFSFLDLSMFYFLCLKLVPHLALPY